MPTVLITGASRGIGLEFARQYAADGWTVHATCRDQNRAGRLTEAAAAAKGNIRIVEMDVDNKAQVFAVADRLRGTPIDVLINNAGIVDKVGYGSGAYEGHDDPDLRNYDFDGWIDILRTNVLGPARVCGAFVDHLAAGERPVAVNMVSLLASIEKTWQAGRYAYRTSKAALNMLTRSAGEWYEKKGIILVSISPGWTRTDMGGPKATNSVEQAVGGVRKVIASLKREDTGKFFNFDGSILPW